MGVATLHTALAAGGAVAAYGVWSTVSSLRANIRVAKRSGLKYVVAREFRRMRPQSRVLRGPWSWLLTFAAASPFNMPSQMLYNLWSPLVRCLPKSWWEDWIL